MTNSHAMQRDAFEAFEDRLGQNIAARLSDTTDHLPHDISERLKAMRMQALAKRKVVKLETAAVASVRGGVVTMHEGDGDRSLWNRLASLLPLFALIVGLLTIAIGAEENRTKEIADVDTELLTDVLPPAAYTDPGFAQFLRMKHHE